MADITIAWDPAHSRGDWVLSDGDLQTGSDLENAILISLFTDRVAQPGYVAPDGSTDRRGCWIDSYEPSPIGSRLWQLMRRKKIGGTALLRETEGICSEALQWLIDDGVAQSISIVAVWWNVTSIAVTITVAMPDGTSQPFRYGWAWKNI